MATIKDIAQLVSVSQATVSRVLKGDKSLAVSPETRQAIFEAAQRAGLHQTFEKNPVDR